MDFEIFVDSDLLDIWPGAAVPGAPNKHLLSLVNDFESGAWRAGQFDNFIWDNIAETALSMRERLALSGLAATALKSAAKNLRLTDSDSDFGRGSELAEVVLYGIMKNKYSALPVVPKIFYKQNSQDNAKGADSVHIVIDKAGDFTLWLGESKFYNSIEDARLTDIISSIETALQTEKLKKESSIVTSVTDLDLLELAPELVSAIKAALSPSISIDHLKPKLHIPILLLHECQITKAATALTDEYRKDIIAYHSERACAYFTKQASKLTAVHDYTKIHFHLILFPVPSKTAVVDKFLKGVTYLKS
jgi:hypothetical protein